MSTPWLCHIKASTPATGGRGFPPASLWKSFQARVYTEAMWWKEAVIYQVYPRSFQDTNGDGVGDLEGVRRRLPYLKSLGVGAVWLSPFYKSPMKDFGYDVADYCDVDPIFGTLEDFDRS